LSTPSCDDTDSIIDIAMAEDMCRSDITSEILIPPGLTGTASVLIKENGVLAGIEIALGIFQRLEPSIQTEALIRDGSKVKSGDIAATIHGRVIDILRAERVALNILQRLSGIATVTSDYVEAIRGTQAKIYDTRKTTPGLRLLEKYAVRAGGGENHRLHLGDSVLIKDNHLAALSATGMSLQDIVTKAKQSVSPGVTVEVEVSSLPETQEAIAAGADVIMLDNMNIEDMGEAVKLIAGKATIEASGGITLENVRQVAMTGVDMISVGALTHSPRSLDISIELDEQSLKL